jgi:hypothetical protein
MAKFQVGDSVVFGRCKRNKVLSDVTIGKIYEIEGINSYGDVWFTDDVGDVNFGASKVTTTKPTKLVT